MPDQSRHTVIIGGGAIGLSIAYHLAARGLQELLLLERHQLSSGTSWHAAGIIGPLRASKAATQLATYAPGFFHDLEQFTGSSTGYIQTGGWWLSQTPARDVELQRIADLGRSLNFNIDLINAKQLAQQESWINCQGISSAMWVQEDGQANPVDICQSLAKGATSYGAEIRENQQVVSISREPHKSNGYRLSLHNSDTIHCQNLVICGGMWSNQLLAHLDIHLPLQGVEHMYLITEDMADLPNPVPITRDLDSGIYCKGDAGKLVLGGFEANPKIVHAQQPALQSPYALFDEDWQQFEPFINAGIERFPQLAQAGIKTFINGPESFTHDTQPLLGPIANNPGLYVACGMNSLGIVSAPGVGKSIAEWILDGQPQWDLLAQDVSRVRIDHSTHGFVQARMVEAVENQFAMHWPYKQVATARGLKRTPVHEQMRASGAVFGNLAGWERPLWFSSESNNQDLDYSFEQQHWWPQVQQEGHYLSHQCGLMDLSPFSKIHIKGPHAVNFMRKLCTRNMDMPLLQSHYCLVLNQHAGIIADVTVSRLAHEHYCMVAAVACHNKLLDWCRQQASEYALTELHIEDASQLEAVLAVAGPLSHQLLDDLCLGSHTPSQLTFGEVAHMGIDMVPTRITRLSFVGENGYELYCPTEFAAYLYETLMQRGSAYGLRPIGMHTIDACRMEKGFVHWGHDIGPNDNPLSANLMFAVDLNHPFTGHQALAELATRGVASQRRLLQITATHLPTPLLYHDEPVYCPSGQLLGHTTSGAQGARTNTSLCMAYLDSNFTNQSTNNKHCYVLVAGQKYPARILEQSAYDPLHQRMRDLPNEQ